MPASRKVFVLALVALACHFVALAVHSAIASNILEFLLVVFAATACFQAAGRASGYARRFWRLTGTAFALYALGQAMATYYDSVLHASFQQYWPSDILFLFHVAPLALALFLGDDSAESRVYRWQRWLDFLQIGIVSLSAYFFFLYLPLQLPHSRASIDTLYVEVTAGRGLLIAGAFVLRATLTNSKLVRSLFGRVAIFLVIFFSCEVFYDYVEVWWHVPFGTWYELLWTVPRTLMVWLATSWVAPKEPEPALKESSSESLLLAQFAHIAFPLLVLAMATRAIGQQVKLAVAAVLASFGCSSVRLLLSQRAQSELLAQQKRDLTERRKLEQQFRQAQKMESVGTLAGGIAHDFNNLLTVILSYSSSLADELAGDSRHQRAAEQIREAAERGAALTRQMLAFSRQQVFHLRVVNLNDIIRNLLKMLQRIIGEHIEIKTALADDLKLVKADPGQLEQVLMNLSVNARDAMPKGGKLMLETHNVVLDEDFVRQHVGSSPGPHVLLTVSDTGTGIDREVITRIFEPFFTTKGAGRGTGLGLAMVYGVVKQTGGSIWVKSELGAGTSFQIYLPQTGETSEAPASKKLQTSLQRGHETILLVEDDPGVRDLARAMLKAQGYSVLVAEHPGDVEHVCKAHLGEIHLLLTDMILPGASGREIAKRVGSLRPGIKGLYMSGYTDDALIRSHGFDESSAFLQKPFSQDGLAAKVREVLDADGFRLP